MGLNGSCSHFCPRSPLLARKVIKNKVKTRASIPGLLAGGRAPRRGASAVLGPATRLPARRLMPSVKYLFKKEALLCVQDLSTRGAGRAGRPAGLFAPKAKETLEKLRNRVFLLLL